MMNIFFKNRVVLSVIFLLLILTPGFVKAEESEASKEATLKKYQVTFPIAELGNCSSLENCKAFCNEPANQQVCKDYAQKKGFYKGNKSEGNARLRSIIEKAKSELGCSTESDCKTLCQKTENLEKCAAFARKYSLVKENSKIKELIEKAKEILGCDSEESCKALCQKSENSDKCKALTNPARFEAMKKSMEKMREAVKKDVEEFDKVCKENPEKCKEFFEKSATASGRLGKPLSCDDNPERCLEFMKNSKRQASSSAQRKQEREDSGRERLGFPGQPDALIEVPDEFLSVDSEEDVQGVSVAPSIFWKILNFFFK